MSSRDFKQNESPRVSTSPKIEELLKMLQRGGGGDQSSNGSMATNKYNHHPPLPPKPKNEGTGLSIEAAKRSLGLVTSTNDNSNNNNNNNITNKCNNRPCCFTASSGRKCNCATDLGLGSSSNMIHGQHDTSAGITGYEKSSSINSSSVNRQQVPPRARAMLGGCVVYDSTQQTKSQLADSYNEQPAGSTTVTIESRKFRPFVTEYLDEAYHGESKHDHDHLNELSDGNQRVRQQTTSTTTVEISEVPILSGSSDSDRISNNNYSHAHEDHDHNGIRSLESSKSSQSDRHNKATPFITPATDDDDSDNNIDLKLPMANNEPTGSIFSSSTDSGGPPRTSTPSSYGNSQLHYENGTSPTGTNTNNLSSKDTFISHGTKGSSSSNDDTLNISRETDELTNASIHNQSGGCELIGVNDNSDSKDQSPSSFLTKPTKHNSSKHSKPFTPIQFFNETNSVSPAKRSILQDMQTKDRIDGNNTMASDTFACSSQIEQETEQLRGMVDTLHKQIGHLNEKVASLTNKVDDLEGQLEAHRKENSVCSMSRSMTTSLLSPSDAIMGQRDRVLSPFTTSRGLVKQTFSQSTSTINRLTPKNARNNNNNTYGQTYSRNATPLSSAKRHHKYDYDKSSQPLPSRNDYADGASTLRTSGNHHHTSTGSLYGGENNNTTTSSISPTFSSARQSTLSPNYSRDKRDLSTCVSMLSLSSLGTTTLKKGSIAGSVSNLSQIGGTNANLLAQWPSQSNFVPSKHQAKDVLFDEEERIIRMVLYNTLITMRLPSWLGNDYNFDKLVHPPQVKLKLDWVHGYRGRDCRSNLYYLPTGECIYFVASIVVLYNAEAKTQRHYLGHTDNVKCIAIHPNKLIVASGQSAILNRRDKRPIVRVWNTVSLATLRVIGFNEDFDRSICCLAFSRHDQGATLAVVDESSEHTITLLDWQREKNWRIAEANSGHEPVLAIDFHPMDKYAIVAVGRSSVNFWDIRGMTLAKKAGLFDKYDRPKYVLCFTFNDLGETVTGDSNGNIIIWPRGANKPRRIIRDAHSGGVFSILAMRDGSYLTGGRDRRIIEWDESFSPTGRYAELPEHCGGVRFITYGKGPNVLIGTLRNCILIGSVDTEFNVVMQGHVEATTALAIHPNKRKYLTGGFDDQIYLVDCESRQVEWSKCMSQPITSASYSPNGLTLILGSVSGNWTVLDALTLEIVFEVCDGTGTITCVKFSADGQQFALGSSDCHVYIYLTDESGSKFERVGTCVGHSAPVKEIDWSDDNQYIQTQSMNFELLFWRTANCRQLDDDAIVHDCKWQTQNCTIGFTSMGIWSDSIDSALINYCDRSNRSDLVVSSTDTGYINIYRAPTHFNQCLSHKYYGNVDKFNFIKFLHDDSKLIAVGAKNCATTEWIIERLD